MPSVPFPGAAEVPADDLRPFSAPMPDSEAPPVAVSDLQRAPQNPPPPTLTLEGSAVRGWGVVTELVSGWRRCGHLYLVEETENDQSAFTATRLAAMCGPGAALALDEAGVLSYSRNGFEISLRAKLPRETAAELGDPLVRLAREVLLRIEFADSAAAAQWTARLERRLG